MIIESRKFGKAAGLILAFCLTGLVLSFFVFNFAYAADFRLVPECKNAQGESGPCGWTEFVQLLDNFLKFSVIIAVPIAAAMFAWAGFLYLSARGNPGQITKASHIFVSVAVGFVVVLCAWLIIDFVLKNLTDANSYIRLLE